MPEIHDSVLDSQMAMQAALHVKRNGLPEPISRTVPLERLNDVHEASLLVHKIPEVCTNDHIFQMIIANTNIVPLQVLPISRMQTSENSFGKTSVIFSSKAHAELAFASISGPNRPDKNDKPQKRVYLKGGGYICIRK